MTQTAIIMAANPNMSMQHSATLATTYTIGLVVLSYGIAVLDAYTALALAERLAAARGRARSMWLLCGACAMGTGIWSMHFTGMLAMHTTVPISYHIPTVALSLLIAVGASAVALYAIRKPLFSVRALLRSGTIMGCGIAAMHYVGMRAMQIHATVHYDPALVLLSILVAIAASMVALYAAFLFRQPQTATKGRMLFKLLSALLMGAAITGMHYIGMRAAMFMPTSQPVLPDELGINATALGVAIGGATLLTLAMTLAATLIDRRFAAQSGAFHSLFVHHPEAVYSLDLAGMITHVNPAAAALIGYHVDELTNIPFVSQIAAEARSQVHHALFQATKGVPQSYETALVHRNGQQVLVRMLHVPIQVDGRTTALYSLLQDITERKRVEAALEAERASLAQRVAERTTDLSAANQDLARAVRLKDDFLASMSHELRTPLNAVLGLTESLQEGVYGSLSREQAGALGGIHESGAHLLALINDILELSKIESGNATLRDDDIGIVDLCEASLRMIKQHAHKKQIAVARAIDPAITIIHGDARRLKQMLVNLLSNAVKFTPAGGAVTLDVCADAANQQLHIHVRDTGIGIAIEDQQRLFQPFVQLDSSLARHYAGTGLGLVLVQRMAKLHGGDVAVQSAPGQGSTFSITLPWQQPALQPARHQALPAPTTALAEDAAQSTATIMLVEDNELNIMAFGDYLASYGYRVIVAHNGHEALACLQHVKPNLILMDIQMPDLNGFDTIERIRADNATARTPIIAITALAMPNDEQRCLAAGANAYLSKPVNLQTIAQTIANHLDQVA